MDAPDRVHHEQKDVRFGNREPDLSSDLDIHGKLRVLHDAAGVHEPEGLSGPIRTREVPVARRTSFVRHDRRVSADDSIEERGLPDVRPAYQADYGDIDAAHRDATIAAARSNARSGSLRTSMKS